MPYWYEVLDDKGKKVSRWSYAGDAKEECKRLHQKDGKKYTHKKIVELT